MLPTLPYLTALSGLAVLLVPRIHAQDVIHFMDNTEVAAKVLEVGIDSIVYIPQGVKNAQSQRVPNAFIKFIEYQRGPRYFVEHSQVFLIGGQLILALIERYDEKYLYYKNVYTREAKRLPLRKVVAIRYDNDHRVNFMDKINLQDGDYLGGNILEIDEEAITFENVARRGRKEDINVDRVRSIEFKNGFEQEFMVTQPNN
ncbi:hypothetical protein [Tunicatimonas pelagia]|uniref:hypothetical protein n=1 Tax=Tunicatimonas pelagia TaxID=931531 RepID=UPI0026666E84|nr:hypothetical protein [Tunicatimonas pelagia]WKN43782.1 hypothetical protein P0M28_02195 [Tunicatimonas pelagia]